jgi:quercetin dioxygenase-like cupin family protein
MFNNLCGIDLGKIDPVSSDGLKVTGPIAQRLEQQTHNLLVPGSNPGGPTMKQRKSSAMSKLRVLFLGARPFFSRGYYRGAARSHFVDRNSISQLQFFQVSHTNQETRSGGPAMRSKLFWAGVFVCLATAFTLAQDPTKVEPKHYKLDFENDKVQVIAVHYGPHERSVLHEHPGGAVVSITAAHLRFTDENGKVREVYSKPGEVHWYPPFKHKVENLGDTPYDAVYIGMREKPAAANESSNPLPAMDAETRKAIIAYLSLSASAKR